MKREYYTDSIETFLSTDPDTLPGIMAKNNEFALDQSQRDAWLKQFQILQSVLPPYQGRVWFEYSIPRMGKRIDTVLIIGSVIFVLEFKTGAKEFNSYDIDQVWDYALDLKNFHDASHEHFIAPVLVATDAHNTVAEIAATPQNDRLIFPIKTNEAMLAEVIEHVLWFAEGDAVDPQEWANGRYCPTPTIIEAAMALYRGHSVHDISRSDAGAINLTQTTDAICRIIHESKSQLRKSICFVTGVPGAGKTLVGLNIATTHIDKSNDLYSVFLSGNDPLVAILREALARDRVQREKERGTKVKKAEAMSEVKAFIQNIRHFRDDCLVNPELPPIEHVAIFDEAQRAWDVAQTSSFMQRKKGLPGFSQSEPNFLLSCLDRHADWAVIICLIGGGQEINTGEAGISEWIESLQRSFPDWHTYISPNLTDSEYGAGRVLDELKSRQNVVYQEELHLSVSMRSFRAEHVSLLVKQLLDLDLDKAQNTLEAVQANYPIVITRDLCKAKQWLRQQSRGSERYGIVVSSQAERLKPHAINVKSPIDPVHWFLYGKKDVRSSYYLEDVATEFHVQGLELDWACVTWDADFGYSDHGWEHRSFCGDRWNTIKKMERKNFQRNAYRVLLTRARQGMVIVVPRGDPGDPTRNPAFYDPTFEYLKQIGFSEI